MQKNWCSRFSKIREETSKNSVIISSESDDMQDISLIDSGRIKNTTSKCQLLGESSVSNQQLAELKQTVSELENTIRIKDSHVEKMRRDYEKLYQELKRQQRSNRNIKQQLDDERVFHQKEKEHFHEEIRNYKERFSESTSKYHRHEFERMRAALLEENRNLKDELVEKSRTIYNLCVKSLEIKMTKDSLREKLDKLTDEHLKVMAEMMEKLDEAREELNIIVSEKFKFPLPMSKAKYLQIVKRNCCLVHENATLKLQIQHLIQTVDKLKNESLKSEPVKIDAKAIEQLIERYCRSRRQQKQPFRDKIETRKTSKMETRRAVDQSGDAKLVSKHCEKLPKMEDLSDFNDHLLIVPETPCTQSAPAVVQTSSFQQYHFILESGKIFERNIVVRDMGTNT